MSKDYEILLKLIINKKLFEEDLLPEQIYLKTEKYLLKENPKLNELL